MPELESESRFVLALERIVFGHRTLVMAAFAVITVVMIVVAAWGLRIDSSYSKLLPLKHPYMQTYQRHQTEFGGANRLLIAVMARDGNMFTPEFFEALKTATDEVFFIPGVDRSRVSSLYTPDVRYNEVVEGGIEAGNVIPADFAPTPAGLEQVRENILKAGVVGRLVANDFSGAIVSAQLLDVDPETGQPLDYLRVARDLESRVRSRIETDVIDVKAASDVIDVRMVGFALVIGNIAEGTLVVALFAVVTVLLTLLLVWIYIQSLRVALVPVVVSIVAVLWQLGALVLLGYGVDPYGILVPFIIFAIGVSHGVQKISAVKEAAAHGIVGVDAARRTFRQLFAPAIVALLADLVGFITILLIPVQVIKEMAITASLGVGIVILTDLILLPVLVSYVRLDERYSRKVERRVRHLARLWQRLSGITRKGPAAAVVAVAVMLGILGFIKGRETPIGDAQAGVPELRQDSRYNVDSSIVTSKFSIGVDILNVMVETQPEGCIDHRIMTAIDEFAWHMRNVEGVRDVMSLPIVAKTVAAGWNEGNLKWRVLPRDEDSLVQAVKYVETSTGLLNRDCSVMPVVLYTADHKAETIERITTEVKLYTARRPVEGVSFRLATGNVGVMAATNEEVRAKEIPILLGVFAAVTLMCLITFRSLIGTILVILPLALVSVLVYAVMALVGIGLTVSTLPMVALGAGIGVDYGIYLFSRLQLYLRKGIALRQAYFMTLQVTGSSVFFTGLTLAIGVATWVFSPLKFQADIGVMLTFMFLVNMLAALVLVPALAAFLLRNRENQEAGA